MLRLDELRVGAIMTPRKQVYAIDLNAPVDEIERAIADSPFARMVVYRTNSSISSVCCRAASC